MPIAKLYQKPSLAPWVRRFTTVIGKYMIEIAKMIGITPAELIFKRQEARTSSNHLVADDPLDVLDRNLPLSLCDRNDKRNRRYEQRAQQKNNEVSMVGLPLDRQRRHDLRWQIGDDAGEDHDGHTVADALVTDLLAKIHQERRAGHQHDSDLQNVQVDK